MDVFIKALESMDRNYCNVSKLNYNNSDSQMTIKLLNKKKYLERPFAYEFYHQLRKLIEKSQTIFGDKVFQAEVNKHYQHCFENGKVPDFLIHKKNEDSENFCVIEFKIIRVRNRNNDNYSNKKDIINDFYKLIKFKKNTYLKYKNLYSILIGDEKNIETICEEINNIKKNGDGDTEINIIFFNTDSWKAKQKNIFISDKS